MVDNRGKFCRVKKADLVALLLDHSILLGEMTDQGTMLEDDFANSAPVRKAQK